MSLSSDKDQDRLTALKIIEKRYSFLFEDFWFILLQYLYFEKFITRNTLYLEYTSHGNFDIDGHYIMKHFGFMIFNLIFTTLVGLSGLTTIPYCFKMIKQGKTKTKAFYILTFIQILLQTIFPFMRAGIVIMDMYTFSSKVPDVSHCILVGFQVYSFGNLKGSKIDL